MNREEKIEKTKLHILQILSDAAEPANSIQITESMNQSGFAISERSVRMYLTRLDEEGLTLSHGKRGREITEKGFHEMNGDQLLRRVGFMSAKIDTMTYSLNFDAALRRGTVAVNITLVDREVFLARLDLISEVFSQGYAVGTLVSILYPGESLGSLAVPPGKIGFCTVCSVTLNGILIRHGIPIRSIFSGLLELEEGKATRFSERIDYDRTSIDPLQLFIRARMTNYMGAIKEGTGSIGAGFREIPQGSCALVSSLADTWESLGLKAFFEIGRPNQQLLNIPVTEGSCGVIVTGGLNPGAILEETGEEVTHYALHGLLEYTKLFHFSEMKQRLKSAAGSG